MFIKFNFTAKYIRGKIKQNIFFSHRALVSMAQLVQLCLGQYNVSHIGMNGILSVLSILASVSHESIQSN